MLVLLAVVELVYYVILKYLMPKKLRLKSIDIEIVRTHSSLSIDHNREVETSNANEIIRTAVAIEDFTLKLEDATLAKVETAELTLCVDKVKTGTLKNINIELAKPTEGSEAANFCERARNGSVNLDFELNLKNKIQINASAQQCTCTVQDQEGSKIIINIPNAQLFNESVAPHTTCSVISLISLFVLTVAGIVLTAAYLVLIPINRSISDAPDRLIGVYQSILFLVGVYIAYKTFFKKDISLESVVAESKKSFSSIGDDERWSSMSKEERLAEFYKTQAEMIMYQMKQFSR